MKEIALKFHREYGEQGFEFIQLNPIFDEPIAQKYGKVLFPLIVTLEDENNFLKYAPEGYNYYIEDIANEYKVRTFRIATYFFCFQIFQKYEEHFYLKKNYKNKKSFFNQLEKKFIKFK